MTRIGKFKWFVCSLLLMVILVIAAFWARPVRFFREYGEIHMLLSGAQSRYATVAGHRVHYYAMGSAAGLPVVLVHGLGGRAEDWQNLAPYLVKAGYRVYLPDLPGYGHSDKPADFSYSIADEAAVVVGFADLMGLKRFDLGGWSMGGWVAQRIASANPARVQRLMLFDSAGIYEKPVWDTRLFTPSTPAELEQLYALLIPKPPKLPAFVSRDILRSSRNNHWVIRRAIDSMLQSHDTTDTLVPGLNMPVLIVWGSEDRLLPLSQGEKMHRLIPQSELDAIPGCGHLAPNECAGQIAPKVLEFLK